MKTKNNLLNRINLWFCTSMTWKEVNKKSKKSKDKEFGDGVLIIFPVVLIIFLIGLKKYNII